MYLATRCQHQPATSTLRPFSLILLPSLPLMPLFF
jgi:hypothetical protein